MTLKMMPLVADAVFTVIFFRTSRSPYSHGAGG
jgi:hypothetical protein